MIAPEAPVVLLEGNYLLLRDPTWDALAAQFDQTLSIDIAEPELARRLVARWLGFGLDPAAARARAEDNDLPNARLVLALEARRPELVRLTLLTAIGPGETDRS